MHVQVPSLRILNLLSADYFPRFGRSLTSHTSQLITPANAHHSLDGGEKAGCRTAAGLVAITCDARAHPLAIDAL